MAPTEPARVFISCGQADNSEIQAAKEVAARLEALGFTPYIATEQHSLLAIRENVFPRLTDTEYFLFIDFRRERVGRRLTRPSEFRGSLFSHQELAVASYLEKEVIVFQEKGVKRLDGLIGHLQANCIEFADRSALPDLVAEQVHRQSWSPDWRNQLVVTLNDPAYSDAKTQHPVMGRFFHMRVFNRHHRRTARDCFGYIRSVVANSNGKSVPFEGVELKWAGYIFPAANDSAIIIS